MAGESWPEVPFPEAIDFQEGPGILAKDFCQEGVPLVRLSGLDRGGSVLEGCNFLDPVTVWQRWPHFALQEGDILLSSSASLGRIAIVGRDGVGAIPYTGIIRMRPRDERVHAPFIRYLLEAPDFQRQAEIAGVGSVMRHFGPMHLRQMTLRLPPLSDQCAIANILGTLDAKIDLNQRMNATLEAMSRALFKSWFVNFDPVRAKAEGRDPGLPQAIADLFPNSFEDSEMGEIPKGWSVKTIGELAEIVGGSTPSTKEPAYWSDGIHCWATPKDLSALKTPVLLGTERRITDTGLAQISSGLLPPGTVLLSSRAPIGYLVFAEIPVAINQGFIAMKAKKGVSNLFLRLWASFSHEDILARANGSTFLEISKSNFRPIKLVAPPNPVFAAFDKLVRPIYGRVVSNERESGTLSALRDLLLPKLISGDLRIRNTRGVIEGRV